MVDPDAAGRPPAPDAPPDARSNTSANASPGVPVPGGPAPCPECRAVPPPGARFCPSCGLGLGLPPEAERRNITVLFADLSDFTQLTEQLDPELVRTFIAGALQPLCDCITRWDGFVDKFIGDCVMALFGAPVAHENEAERALRAAEEMHRTLERWAESDTSALGVRPHLRIGVNTGPVVTGVFAGGGARDYTAVGDTVNVAARLQALADPGATLVGPATWEQTRHVFEFGDEQRLNVKGRREPVRARAVLRPRAVRGPMRGIAGRRPALIGRAMELDALRKRWRRVRAGGSEVCLVLGAPGIGKSRLIEELLAVEDIPPEEVAEGRSYPHSSRTPWEPLAEAVRDLYGVPADLPPGEAAARIAKESPAPWGAAETAALSLALGASGPVPELEGYAASERSRFLGQMLTRALEQGATAPRVLLLEDLHWADAATLDFCAAWVKQPLAAPILVIAVTRPALPGEDAVARLSGAVRDRIVLEPLSPRDSRALLEALLGHRSLPPEVSAAVLARAEGNPLFLEEMVRALGDDGLALDAEAGHAPEGGRHVPVPDSVESVLSARIDALDPAARRVLQHASVVGRRFWSGVLADALVHRPVERELDELEQSAFVRSSPASLIEGDREFRFEHLLLQEVAYGGLLQGVRAELHAAVARWLEEHRSRGGAASDSLAFHWERSSEPERSVPYLERAAAAARARGAPRDAAALVERALPLAADQDCIARLLMLAEEIAADTGDAEARASAIERLATLARSSGSESIQAQAELRNARWLQEAGRLPAGRAAAKLARDRFRALGDPMYEADAVRLLGRIAHLWGDYPEAGRCYEASLALERQAGDRLGEAEVLDLLGLVQVDRGDFCRGLAHFDATRQLAAELGARAIEARVLTHRATALRWLGRFAEAEAAAREGLALAAAAGSSRAALGARLTLGTVLAAEGRGPEAVELLEPVRAGAADVGRPKLEARAWLALAEAASGDRRAECATAARETATRCGLVHVQILALTREAELALEAGDVARAARDAQRAAARLRRHGNVQGPEEWIQFVHFRALSAAGRKEAAAALREARRIVLHKAGLIADPALRASFLDVYPNPEILEARDVPPEASSPGSPPTERAGR